MSLSILEVLQNAQYNLCEGKIDFQLTVGKQQLTNAVELLMKDYSLEDDFDEVMDGHDTVATVPYKAL